MVVVDQRCGGKGERGALNEEEEEEEEEEEVEEEEGRRAGRAGSDDVRDVFDIAVVMWARLGLLGSPFFGIHGQLAKMPVPYGGYN